ncbi:MAG TPA: roadblock/LC7 domain-containing protein [Thermoplasmata archaeon]|nr:roadblock/LC7 domain-containing protein [Thermoplasmata archaeon]
MTTVEVTLNAQLASVLERMRRSVEGISAVGLADANGLPIAFLGPSAEKGAATAMAALLVSAGHRAAEALGLPSVREVHVYVDGPVFLVCPIEDRFTLVVILSEETNIGLVRLEMEKAAAEIHAIVASR